MGEFMSSYIFIPLGLFNVRMTRHYFPLLAVSLLSVKLSLKLHMNIVQNLLSTTRPSLFIITRKVSSPFLTWSLILYSLWISSAVTFSYIFLLQFKKRCLQYITPQSAI